jgi:predicted amidohydrolase YtcJ
MVVSKLVVTAGLVGAFAANAQTPAAQTADLVLRGGPVFTADAANPTATAVAVRGGRIVYVGDDAGVEAFVGAVTRTIEIGGGMLLPGFHDSHVHIAAGGLGLATCDLSSDDTADAVLAHIAACARDSPGSAWVSGRGWQLGVFPNADPTRQQLDAVVPDRPAFFMSADGHSGWANSRALAEAEVTAETQDPQGGRIERDPLSNQPTGTLRDIAAALVARRVPQPSEPEIKAAIVRAIALANSFGITSVHEANVPELMLGPYLALDRENALNARVTMAAQFNLRLADVSAVPAEVERIERLRRQYRGARITITAAKLGIDGALEAQTAALLEPYVGGEDRGRTLTQPEVFQAAIVAFDKAGIQTHIHSIGDGATRIALDAFAAARAANGPNGPMHQIAHLQLVHPADVPRFGPLRVAANIQGLWAYRDEETQELVEPVIGPERAARLYPLGSLEQAGATLVGGSDWSVTSMNPLPAIEIAITRRGARQPTGPAWLPDEVVSLDAMLLAYTINGARLQLHEEQAGSITVGKAADLVLLDKDLRSIPAVDINTARVLFTFIDGVQVYPRREPWTHARSALILRRRIGEDWHRASVLAITQPVDTRSGVSVVSGVVRCRAGGDYGSAARAHRRDDLRESDGHADRGRRRSDSRRANHCRRRAAALADSPRLRTARLRRVRDRRGVLE